MPLTDNRPRTRVKRVFLLTLTALGIWFGAGGDPHDGTARGAAPGTAARAPKDDASASREAFREVYKVLMHPRCMNCHPVGDVPLQGDDSRLHIQNVKRGP